MHVYSDPASERHVNHMAGVEAPERFLAALAGAEEAGRAGAQVEHRPCQAAPRSILEAVHSPKYLEGLEELSAAGGGYVDFDTALGPDSLKAAKLAAGAAIATVESALSGTAAFAIARPPGHHSGRAYGMGFCLLNNAAIAAEHALAQGAGRVAILDWDVHHGNGTQDIFYANNEVLYLSVHQSPFYPGTGTAREVGEGSAKGFTVNVPLPARSREDLYAQAFAGLLAPVLSEFRPDLLVVSAGYDAHVADPLGGMQLESASFGRFSAGLASLAREIGAAPLALVLEGGYNLNALTECVAATIKGTEEEASRTWRYAGNATPVETSRKALAPFWESLR